MFVVFPFVFVVFLFVIQDLGPTGKGVTLGEMVASELFDIKVSDCGGD